MRGANQALSHMGDLYQAADELNNLNILPGYLNKPINYIEENVFGDTRQGKFRENAQAVAGELRRVFAGAGGGGGSSNSNDGSGGGGAGGMLSGSSSVNAGTGYAVVVGGGGSGGSSSSGAPGTTGSN